jgi:protein-S-isoprenylcysteine O-methyltransferase Ste14
MIAWINFIVLILSTFGVLYFYVKSVGPAALEQEIGPAAYKHCTIYRWVAGGLMGVTSVNYVVYVFYPLPIGLPETFPWPYWGSALIAVLIALPAGYLMARGIRDAGEETMAPKKEHTLYRGIYEKIRHPQALGEMPLYWVFAFLCHSPFLVLYSFIWIPIFYYMCVAEERDLVLRYGQPFSEYQQRTGMFIPKRSNISTSKMR